VTHSSHIASVAAHDGNIACVAWRGGRRCDHGYRTCRRSGSNARL